MNYQEMVLAALLPHSDKEKALAKDALNEVSKHRITAVHFTGPYKTLFEIIGLHAQRESVLDFDILAAYLDGSVLNDEQRSEVKILYNACINQRVSLDKLSVICKALSDEVAFAQFSRALITTGEILSTGKRIGKNDLKGLVDAKKYLIDNITVLQGPDDSSYPSLSLSESMAPLWEDYFRKETNPSYGLLTGIREIDELTGGFDNGELIIFSAAYGEGKSTILRNCAYHASFKTKKNIVYYTLEMPHKQVARELVSLHSLDPKFMNRGGVPGRLIQSAKLSPEEKVHLRNVTDDIENVEYGIFKIVQLPNSATVSTIRENMMYLQNQFPLHGVFIDYASLLTSEVVRNNTISEAADTFKKLKQLATTFNNGQGVPIITAHQISREARRRVDQSDDKRYDRSFLSDTSEADKSADTIFWCLRTEDMERARELKMGISKNRRGPKIPDWMLRENFACSQVSSIAGNMSNKDKDTIYDV